MSQITIEQTLQRAVEEHQQGRLREAEQLYRQVLSADSSQPDALHLLGVLAYQAKQPDAAIGLIRQALALRPKWPEAYNHLGNALKVQGKLDEAIDSYKNALRLRPTYAEAHLNMGNAVLEKGQLQEAVDCYRWAISYRPDYAEAFNNMANIFKGQGQLEAAVEAYRRALQLQPKSVEVLSNLGNALREQGKIDEAVDCYHQALSIQPDHAATLMNLGFTLRQQGQAEEGLKCYERALAAHPNSPEVHYSVGNIYKEQGQIEEALGFYRRALALRPGYLDALLAMATAFQKGRRFAESIAPLREALRIRPDYPEALLNLGNALHETKEDDKALATYESALELRPNYPDVLLNVGNIQKAKGLTQKAIETYRRALALKPDYAEAHYNLGNTLKNMGRIEDSVESYRRALELRPGYSEAHTNLLFVLHNLVEVTPEMLLAEAQRWNDVHAKPLERARTRHENDPSPDRRLRIGYVSADFRTHSCAFFSAPLLAHHDRAEVEIFCYAQVAEPDAITEQMRQHADHWISTVNMSDRALAERIAADRMDILVDMMGHTGSNRLLVFARKPAPVQVTYLGYPDTTGLSTIDYRLTDAHADPVGATEALHTETLVRLPDTFLCYQPPTPALAVNALPVAGGAPLTFASFNDVAKISAVTVEMWATILKQLPDSRLLLKTKHLSDEAARQLILERFEKQGIGAERLDLRGMTPSVGEHLAVYQQVDLALDPFPYCGTTTTCEALWMGVPLITLAGRAHVSRVGASLLSGVGLEELVASTPGEYIEKAVTLARDHEKLSGLRSGLRERMQNSPLMDGPRFVRNLEAAYRAMWHKWCAEKDAANDRMPD